MIYSFYDSINNITYYYVADATAQATGIALNKKNTTWVVGDINAANAQLAIIQTAFIALPSTQAHITYVKSLGLTPDGSNIWVSCNAIAEPENTNVLYEVFCDVVPGFTMVTGTTALNTVTLEMQQALLTWANLNAVTTLSEMPK